MNIKEDWRKDKYIEGRLSRKDKEIDSRFTYTADDIWNLKEMAKHDVYPDGRFSDEECCIWGWFHTFHREES